MDLGDKYPASKILTESPSILLKEPFLRLAEAIAQKGLLKLLTSIRCLSRSEIIWSGVVATLQDAAVPKPVRPASTRTSLLLYFGCGALSIKPKSVILLFLSWNPEGT